MKKPLKLFVVAITLLTMPFVYAESPDRDKGISVHILPKRVAKLSDQPWGLQVRYAPYLKHEPAQPILQSISDVLEYVKKQNQEVVENGLWVVTTHPNAYDEEEMELQNQIKEKLPKENIPLFWIRGRDLSKGFTRY